MLRLLKMKEKASHKNKKIDLHTLLSIAFLLFFGIIFLAMLLFSLYNRPLDDPEEEKKEKEQRIYRPERGRLTGQEPGILASRPFRPVLFQSGLDDFFMPATRISDTASLSSKQFELDSRKKDFSYSITLSGIKKNDILLTGFYDSMKDGGFLRSQKLKVIPPWEIKENSLKIVIDSLPLRKNQTLQLPILFQGLITSSYSNNHPYTLGSDGKLEMEPPPEQEKKVYIGYTAQRTKRPLSIKTSSEISPWLKKEFKDFPSGVKKTLNKAKKRSELIKLKTVAAILNAYFEYQTSSKEIIKPPGKTWNYFLKEKIKSEKKLAADCDVLAAYAYIYFKFLDLHPALIIGYFNLPGQSSQLETEHLHATLYLLSGEGPLLFEPTLFVRCAIRVEAEALGESEFTSADKGKTNYFLPSKKIMDQFEKSPQRNPQQHLSQTWDAIEETEEKKILRKPASISIQFIYNISIGATIFSLLILMLIIYAKQKQN